MQLPQFYILPKGFDLDAIIQRKQIGNYYNMRPERYQKAFAFITLINWFGFVEHYGKERSDGWVQMKASLLERLLGKGFPKQIRFMLEDLGIIECDNRYIVGQKSLSFRLKPLYANRQQVTADINDIRWRDRIARFNAIEEAKTRHAIDSAPYQTILENLQQFQFSSDAQTYIKLFENRRQSHRQMCFDLLAERTSFFTIDGKSGRCFHTLTSTPKEMREFLRIDGEKAKEVDIPNAQPLLAATLYDSNKPDHCEEKTRYIRFIEADFYLSIAKAAGRKTIDRDKIKTACYKEIFFNPKPSTGRLWKAFEKLFPALAGLINKRKLASSSGFAIYLQNAEADLVIHRVGMKLAEADIPYATVHDSVIVKKRQARVVRKWMREAVEDAIGQKVKLKF